jgi:prepilin-type N-terminal cleavage/methylation domain-containing protein
MTATPLSSRPACRGFTLLEVMVAMAVLATAFTALLGLHVRNLQTVARDQAYLEAILLARTLITEVELAGSAEIGSSSGDFEASFPGEYPGFRWERTVADAQLGLGLGIPDIREVRVRVIPPLGEAAAAELSLYLGSSGT